MKNLNVIVAQCPWNSNKTGPSYILFLKQTGMHKRRRTRKEEGGVAEKRK